MAEYRVNAVKQEACTADANFVHVTAVETGNGPPRDEFWTVNEVCCAIALGDYFYLKSPNILQTANLRIVVCPGCSQTRALESGSKLAGLDIHKLTSI
jgi:hypothetical protein